jgi:hypothetical protein
MKLHRVRLILMLALAWGLGFRCQGTPSMEGHAFNEARALSIAREFLSKQYYAGQYNADAGKVYAHSDEYQVEFPDVRKHLRPGVCIVGVDRKTGVPHLIPVE